jgi:hypothetical protein
MPRIEPVPLEDLDPELRSALEGAWAEGRIMSQTQYAQLMAYVPGRFRPYALEFTKATRPNGLCGERMAELVRIRSAQIAGCEECRARRYEPSVTEDDVSCMLIGADGDLDERERLAMRFVELMHNDHDAIDDAFYRELAQHFTTAEIVDLGLSIAGLLGQHRFIHTLNLLGTDPPAIPHNPDQVGAVTSPVSVD